MEGLGLAMVSHGLCTSLFGCEGILAMDFMEFHTNMTGSTEELNV